MLYKLNIKLSCGVCFNFSKHLLQSIYFFILFKKKKRKKYFDHLTTTLHFM